MQHFHQSSARASGTPTSKSPQTPAVDTKRVVQFGVLGTANIARKNIRALKLSKLCRIAAVASRSVEKAQAYADENQLGSDVAIYGTYMALLEDTSIDAVYLPLPTTTHMEWVQKAAAARKHIVLEKPVALDHVEFLQMIRACQANGVGYILC